MEGTGLDGSSSICQGAWAIIFFQKDTHGCGDAGSASWPGSTSPPRTIGPSETWRPTRSTAWCRRGPGIPQLVSQEARGNRLQLPPFLVLVVPLMTTQNPHAQAHCDVCLKFRTPQTSMNHVGPLPCKTNQACAFHVPARSWWSPSHGGSLHPFSGVVVSVCLGYPFRGVGG